MTATRRTKAGEAAAIRPADDFFSTPAWVTDAILPHLPLGGRILEPSAGDGAIVKRLLVAGVTADRITGIELDPIRRTLVEDLGVRCFVGDALLMVPEHAPDLTIQNPSFALAEPFVRWALEHRSQGGTVATLLRLAFLAGRARAALHRAFPGDAYVLSKRPSFTGKGTDSAEYMWLVHGPGRGGRYFVLEPLAEPITDLCPPHARAGAKT